MQLKNTHSEEKVCAVRSFTKSAEASGLHALENKTLKQIALYITNVNYGQGKIQICKNTNRNTYSRHWSLVALVMTWIEESHLEDQGPSPDCE